MFFLNLSLVNFWAARWAIRHDHCALSAGSHERKKSFRRCGSGWMPPGWTNSGGANMFAIPGRWSCSCSVCCCCCWRLRSCNGAPANKRASTIAAFRLFVLDGAAERHCRLLDEAKQKARAYVASLPPRDRVMVMRADGLTTPVTSFTDNRKQSFQAIAAKPALIYSIKFTAGLGIGNPSRCTGPPAGAAKSSISERAGSPIPTMRPPQRRGFAC